MKREQKKVVNGLFRQTKLKAQKFQNKATTVSITPTSMSDDRSSSVSITMDQSSGELIHDKVLMVRNDVEKSIRGLTLQHRLEYLTLLTMEIKSLTRSNQSQLSRKRAKGRPASLSH